jgi:hypothetical protein
MASPKVHLRRYAQSSSLQRTFQVRLIPQFLQALQLELFAVPCILILEKLIKGALRPFLFCVAMIICYYRVSFRAEQMINKSDQ